MARRNSKKTSPGKVTAQKIADNWSSLSPIWNSRNPWNRHRASRYRVKSIRNGKANLRDGLSDTQWKLQLHNVHISPHTRSQYFNHDPLRTRRLLAHRREIDKLRGTLDQKGLALIPLNIHLKGSWIKLTIGLGKGRKLHDKRAAEKEKQSKKEVKAAIARYSRWIPFNTQPSFWHLILELSKM